MTTTAMTLGEPPPPRPTHIGYVTSNANGSYTTREFDAVTPLAPLPVIGGTIINGQERDLTGAHMYFGEAGRELGVELELVAPDIPIDEARRIAAHRQRDIERLLGGDSPEG